MEWSCYLFLGLELGVNKTVAVEKLVNASPALAVRDSLCVDHSDGGMCVLVSV